MRVFLGLTEIAGYYRGLRAGFEELGIECTFIDLSQHPFEYGGGDPSVLADLVRALGRRGRWGRRLRRIPRDLLFLWAASRFDVFIFGFGTSFLPHHRDLPILKGLGKKVLFQFHGSDSRPPYLDGSVMARDTKRTIEEGIRIARAKKDAIRTIERYADVVINTPPQGHFHERPFVLWLRVGLPSRPARFPTVIREPPDSAGRLLRILHSPSHPEAKGSGAIRRAVERLKAQGVPLELIEIHGQPNRVVLEELERCDFVIDQLYADYGMPGFATEAAWFGKPVVIGGYAKPLWDRLLPPDWIPPTHYCDPEEIDHAIARMARDVGYRRDLGRRARAFVETQWHPKRIAERYLELATKPVPDAWLYHPSQNRYWEGCCLSADRTRELIRAFIAGGGKEALQVSDKPELERLLVEVAR